MGVRAGFAGRLALGLGVALLVVYGLLGLQLVARAGGPDRYVAKSDFLSIATGVQLLADGQAAQLYDEPTQATTQAAMLRDWGYGSIRLLPFNHPPFELIAFAGLHALGVGWGGLFLARTLLSLLAIGAACAALAWGWPLPGTTQRVAAAAALTFLPLTIGLYLGQNTALALLGWAAGGALLRRGYPGWAGLALALAAVKPQTLPVLLLALLLMGQWRALVAWAGAVAAAVALTLPVLGATWPLRYGALLLDLALRPPDAAIDPATMQNWRGLFARLLGPGLPATGLTAAATLLSLGLVVAVWWMARRRRGATTPGAPGWDRAWALTLLLALLVDPHLQLHDLALAVVPAWIILATEEADRRWALWLGVGWVVGFLAVFRPPLLVPAALWLAGTAGALLWQAWRGPARPADMV